MPVATSQPLAAQAGLALRYRGGTAADAVFVISAVMTVLEPATNGIGGDAFALGIFGREVVGLNAFGRAPANQPRRGFDGQPGMPRRDLGPITVQGVVRDWVALWREHRVLPFT